MALTAAERQRRSRAHRSGDHSGCDPARCPDVTPAVTTVTSEDVTPDVTEPVPAELRDRGRRLYREVLEEHQQLGARERIVLEEAARTADRLDMLDRLLRGDAFVWARIEFAGEGRRDLVVDKTLAEARQQQGTLARLLGELRQSLAPAAAKEPPAPANPAPSTSGGGKLADLTARIAQRRGQTAG
jgi:hypothetical protein